jgi:hypothetical protein
MPGSYPDRQAITALRPAGILPADLGAAVSYFFAARARLPADFPACFAARPVDAPADLREPTASSTARRAESRELPAALPCRVPAAFVPAAPARLRCWLRLRVAAAFFAAAERSAFVCGIATSLFGGVKALPDAPFLTHHPSGKRKTGREMIEISIRRAR